MKKFKFRLQKVLELRERIEDDKKKIVQDIGRQLEQLRSQKKALLEQRTREEQAASEQFYQLRGTFLAGILEKLRTLEKQIEEKNIEYKEAQRVYLEAYKEAETLRKIKEKRLKEYKELLEREESKNFDELATLQYGRARKN